MTESKAERLDRELGELLQELRVLLPGVQVLFAFLLTVPFTVGFAKSSDGERALFFAALLTTATAMILLVAPGVRHRGRFREGDKEALIKSSNRLALAGTGFIAASVAMVAGLVAEVLYGWEAGTATGVFVVLLAGWFWYGWALARERSDRTT